MIEKAKKGLKREVTKQGSRVRPNFVSVRLTFFLGRTGAPNVLASAASARTFVGVCSPLTELTLFSHAMPQLAQHDSPA